MKKSEMEIWCKALESGKYLQTTGILREVDETTNKASYCCLGVGCHLKAPAAWNNERSITKNAEILPLSIMEAMTLNTKDGDLGLVPHEILKKHKLLSCNLYDPKTGFFKSGPKASSLADINDTLNWDFKKISAFIRDAYEYL